MKGQYFSFDAIIAAVIFVMALVALLSYWHSVKSYLDYQNDQLSRDAIRVSNLLFTPPAPSSDCNSMTRLGLSFAWDDRRINASLLDCAETKAASNQTWLKEELSTPFNVSITVKNVSANPSVTIATIGDPVPSNAVEVVIMTRLATVFNESSGESYPASIDLSMYR